MSPSEKKKVRDIIDEKPPKLDIPTLQREVTRRLRPFAITYSLVAIPRILRILSRKGPLPHRLSLALNSILRPGSTVLKLSAFPALLPLTYQTILPLIQSILGPSYTYSRELAALLSSPLTLLLPHGLRVYLGLYAVTSAMTTFFKSASPKEIERKVLEGKAAENGWRDYLPPVTLLNALGNSWMVWSWYHEKGVFPKSYEKLILESSPHYCPPSRPALEIRDFLETTLNPLAPPNSSHKYLVCETLHPLEPSCLKNHALAWYDGVLQTTRWVAGFGLLSTLLTFKKTILSTPTLALKDWLNYVIRGVFYVNGSIQTVWGVTCVLQRIFQGDFMPKNRWIINGSVASLWIYALPPKRQVEISVYVARISILSLWRAYLKHGGWYLTHGEVLIFAAGWASLVRLREEGWRIEGLMRRAITFAEGKEEELKMISTARWTPGVSRVGSAEDLTGNDANVGLERLEIGKQRERMESMSTVTDSGFSSADEDGGRGEIKILSSIRE